MAQIEEVLHESRQGTARFQVIAIVETTQTVPDGEGDPSPLMVAVRVFNNTTKTGRGRWIQSNGQTAEQIALPGENMTSNIATPRRPGVYYAAVEARWGS